jgi:hypothetical protein
LSAADNSNEKEVPLGKIPKGYVSIHDPRYDNYFSVEPETGRLFWNGKEIVARKIIDFSNISWWWKGFAAAIGILAGAGSALSGLVDLNKEICLFHFGSCNVVATLPPPPAQPLKPHSP